MKNIRDDIQFNEVLHDQHMQFSSTWGLFSPDHVDEGTKLLIENIDIEDGEDSLDIGCGYGAIGLTLAKLSPSGTHHLIDRDFVAIDQTKKNAKMNNVKNIEVYLSNSCSGVPSDAKFDVIVSNLPAKVGNEMLTIIMQDAKNHLNKGGRFYVVTVAGLTKYIKRNFTELFGNYKKVSLSKTYTVSCSVCTRPHPPR